LDIADQRIRFEAERAADFYDELATDDVRAFLCFVILPTSQNFCFCPD
jgi:hypothetical protein